MAHREREVINQVHVECKYIFIFSYIIKMKEHRVKPSSIPKASVGGKRNSMRIHTIQFIFCIIQYSIHIASCDGVDAIIITCQARWAEVALLIGHQSHRIYDKIRFHSMYFHFYMI